MQQFFITVLKITIYVIDVIKTIAIATIEKQLCPVVSIGKPHADRVINGK